MLLCEEKYRGCYYAKESIGDVISCSLIFCITKKNEPLKFPLLPSFVMRMRISKAMLFGPTCHCARTNGGECEHLAEAAVYLHIHLILVPSAIGPFETICTRITTYRSRIKQAAALTSTAQLSKATQCNDTASSPPARRKGIETC